MKRNSWYSNFTKVASRASARPAAFGVAAAIVLLWLASGPLFRFNETWQLAINTTTTIITFLMVFLIQDAQNRDTQAMQVKLDELIRVTEGAHLALLDLEELDAAELDKFRKRYEKLARDARSDKGKGKPDTGTPEA